MAKLLDLITFLLKFRNAWGEIIAKSTIYVNRKEGYAVFNNVESSLNHRAAEDIEKIYKAFLRGAKAFFDTYNRNNKDYPISNISIGSKRNTIINHLTNERHPIVSIQKSLQYGSYALNQNYGYDGDWSTSQRLVLKK